VVPLLRREHLGRRAEFPLQVWIRARRIPIRPDLELNPREPG
jgi:hypothetical protein